MFVCEAEVELEFVGLHMIDLIGNYIKLSSMSHLKLWFTQIKHLYNDNT